MVRDKIVKAIMLEEIDKVKFIIFLYQLPIEETQDTFQQQALTSLANLFFLIVEYIYHPTLSLNY